MKDLKDIIAGWKPSRSSSTPFQVKKNVGLTLRKKSKRTMSLITGRERAQFRYSNSEKKKKKNYQHWHARGRKMSS
jgi:hypothetical protein